ncbi:hypothetical protein [uncultured Parasphingorhabdus sp.]|uniref:hypothetical protein n=1 Tax=uncultured Parasphingorhabdus sp. TaxID=2709694 RepID=UPI0030DA2BCB|tara:strand:+ start:77244 stop:77909 length:666 start_codon:yes stop_codon:yes gene_type:complete
MTKKTSKTAKTTAAHVLEITPEPGEAEGTSFARVSLDPVIRHANLAMSFASQAFGDGNKPSMMASTEALQSTVAKAEAGDMRVASRLLASQAVTLDTMFTELARRSANNMGSYPDAADRYMRLALRAQSNCRATVDSLAKLHQPREQTVRHVHVNEGGQAVVADHFHNHTGVNVNAKSAVQSHATGKAGECNALPSQNAQGNGVPIPSGEGAEAVQDAWRD